MSTMVCFRLKAPWFRRKRTVKHEHQGLFQFLGFRCRLHGWADGQMLGRLVPLEFFYTIFFPLNLSSLHSFLSAKTCLQGRHRELIQMTTVPCSFRLDLAKLLRLLTGVVGIGGRLPPLCKAGSRLLALSRIMCTWICSMFIIGF